jgi:membrane protease YdiL (CAAX protease family)
MKRIIIFLAITFGITFSLEFGLLYPLFMAADQNPTFALVYQLLLSTMMLIPALGALLTRLISKEGLRQAMIKPQGKGRAVKYFLIAWFGPAVLTTLGAILYFCLNPADFDPAMATYKASLASQMQAASPNTTLSEATIAMIGPIQLVVAVLFSPILNSIFCFGEEWGWRGYLVPKLNERLSFIPTVLISGVIWGLWHAPVINLGHNYGFGYHGYPWLGIAAMCLFCVVLGTLFSYLTIKTHSCLPAVIGHGAVNGFASAPLLFSLSGGDPFIGPLPVGLVGGSAFIVVALVICVRMRKDPGFKTPAAVADAPPVHSASRPDPADLDSFLGAVGPLVGTDHSTGIDSYRITTNDDLYVITGSSSNKGINYILHGA